MYTSDTENSSRSIDRHACISMMQQKLIFKGGLELIREHYASLMEFGNEGGGLDVDVYLAHPLPSDSGVLSLELIARPHLPLCVLIPLVLRLGPVPVLLVGGGVEEAAERY